MPHEENKQHSGQLLTSSFERTWYWYFESLFWPEQVMRIREICEQKDEEEAVTVGTEGKFPDHGVRKNKVSWHDNDELYTMLRPVMERVNVLSGWNYNLTAIEPIQYTIYYGDENHYDWHTDTIVDDQSFHPAYQGAMKNTIRKVSCTIQLSNPDEYEGGNFELLSTNRQPYDDKKGLLELTPISLPHTKEKGSALFFTSCNYHRVTSVTKGIRRSLVCWFRGPKWV